MTKPQKAVVNQWLIGSKRDLALSDKLFNDKVYNYSLFFLQLSLEKILKAVIVVREQKAPPPIHKLEILVRKAGLTQISKDHSSELKEITKFHIAARYDDYKTNFYKKATKEFASRWRKIGIEIYNKIAKTL